MREEEECWQGRLSQRRPLPDAGKPSGFSSGLHDLHARTRDGECANEWALAYLCATFAVVVWSELRRSVFDVEEAPEREKQCFVWSDHCCRLIVPPQVLLPTPLLLAAASCNRSVLPRR